MRAKKNSGFTLVEIVVSLVVILGIAVGGLAAVFHSRQSAVVTQQKMVAYHLAEKKIVELKKQGAKNVAVTATPVALSLSENDIHNGVIELTVSQPDAANDCWKFVKVTVGWDYPWKAEQVHTKIADCSKKIELSTFLFQE